MITRTVLRYFLVAAILGSTSLSAQPSRPDITLEISAALKMQQDAWNRGDIDAFMDGYSRSDETPFVSGDDVRRGWQKVLDRYKKKYSDRAQMGTLAFSNLGITPLRTGSAVRLGSWQF